MGAHQHGLRGIGIADHHRHLVAGRGAAAEDHEASGDAAGHGHVGLGHDLQGIGRLGFAGGSVDPVALQAGRQVGVLGQGRGEDGGQQQGGLAQVDGAHGPVAGPGTSFFRLQPRVGGQMLGHLQIEDLQRQGYAVVHLEAHHPRALRCHRQDAVLQAAEQLEQGGRGAVEGGGEGRLPSRLDQQGSPGAQLGGCTVLGQVSVIAQHSAQKGRKIAQESLQRGPTKNTGPASCMGKAGFRFKGPDLSLNAECCI